MAYFSLIFLIIALCVELKRRPLIYFFNCLLALSKCLSLALDLANESTGALVFLEFNKLVKAFVALTMIDGREEVLYNSILPILKGALPLVHVLLIFSIVYIQSI